jgi:hypothetical protein
MKLAKLSLVVAAFAVAICLKPSVGWSSRPNSGGMVTGQVTAMPGNGEIEIANQLYHIRANSAAAKALSSIYIGENVNAVLDAPAASTTPGRTAPGSTAPEIVILTVQTPSS